MNDELDNIKNIIEKVLAEKYPNFPKQVVYKILEIQKENSVNPVDAQKKVSAFLSSYLKDNPDVTF